MDQIFQPIQDIFKDLGSNLLKLATYVAIVGIIICGFGATTGSEKSKEKFKTGFIVVVGAFVVILLARTIIFAVKGYF
ncbi:hypothetical protein M4L39_13595 [Staphylococcus equorum]|uniref:hypothetical protein n=1 Tax=Staphylococcus equorum TaxID=246432 RepID=UPI001866769D|nr:hypothetical protein [Staphylococcus equorum]MDG0844447.1 hypothetical protein [Staphylococcus equorum]